MPAQLSFGDTLPDTLRPIKSCLCGAAYDAEAWGRLEVAGVQPDGEGGDLELRHCACGSTIAIPLPRPPTPSDPRPNSPEDLGWTSVAVAPVPRARTTFAIPDGTPARSCSTCSAVIFWVVSERGRKMPLDPDGTCHFETCPDAAKFRRAR